jgi:hypothetical protein
MIDVGIVGLNSSHAEAFAGIIDDMDDMDVTRVWNGDRFRGDDHLESFCSRFGVTERETTAELAADVDAAMVLTVDWETHVPLAEPLLEAGVPTLIDKPLTDSISAIQDLERAAKDSRLFGGSAVPFHDAFSRLERGGDERTLFAAGYNDYFYYRVHLTDTVRFLADADWSRVAPTEDPGTTVDIQFENDVHATLRFDGSPRGSTFSVLDVGGTTTAVEIESTGPGLSEMYGPFIQCFRDVVIGDSDHTDRVLDSASLQLAIETAIEHDQGVTPASDTLAAASVGSADFLAEYDPYF